MSSDLATTTPMYHRSMRTIRRSAMWTQPLVFRSALTLAAAALMSAAPARAQLAPVGASSPQAQTSAAPTPPPAYRPATAGAPPTAYPPPPAPPGAPPTAYPPPLAPPGTPPTGYPPPPPVPAPVPGQGAWTAQGPSEVRPGPSGVYVELEADNPNTRIDRVVEGVTIPVCLAPCRRVLDRNNIYVIGGDGVRSTSHFALPDNHDRVTLRVKAGSSSQLAGGAALIAVGGAVGYAGLFLWELSLVSTSVANVNGNANMTAPRGNAGLGLGLMAVGLAVGAIGVYLALTARTTVSSSTGATFSETPPVRRKRPFFDLALTPRGIEF